jgi:hypothetical protein
MSLSVPYTNGTRGPGAPYLSHTSCAILGSEFNPNSPCILPLILCFQSEGCLPGWQKSKVMGKAPISVPGSLELLVIDSLRQAFSSSWKILYSDTLSESVSGCHPQCVMLGTGSQELVRTGRSLGKDGWWVVGSLAFLGCWSQRTGMHNMQKLSRNSRLHPGHPSPGVKASTGE